MKEKKIPPKIIMLELDTDNLDPSSPKRSSAGRNRSNNPKSMTKANTSNVRSTTTDPKTDETLMFSRFELLFYMVEIS